MFCVHCGNELEEQWKVCPKCGTEVDREKGERIVEEPQKKVCEKCGKELQDDWVKCPFCGYTKEEMRAKNDVKKSGDAKRFEFEGFRRTGRFGFKYYKSEIEVNGEELHATIHKKKIQDVTFMKQQILEIKFPVLPVFGVWNIICIVLFLLLMPITYGMSIFVVFFLVKITLVKHMQINLQNGDKINIPIRQKAETAEFLREIGWNENFITSVEASAISDRKLRFREWLISGLMFAVASVAVTIGAETYLENSKVDDTVNYEQDDEVRSLDEVGGYEAWVESEYASKVRADIVVMLPVTQREADTYAVRICTSLGDIIYIKQEDGALATEWDWLMNAIPDIEGGDTATFQATLTIDGYTVFEDEEAVPIFIVEDVESYSGDNQAEQNVSEIIEVDYEYLYGDIMDSIINEVSESGGFPEYLTYTYYDIDKDGYLEFFMQNGISNADMRFEVYSTKDGKTTFFLGEIQGVVSLYEYPEGNGLYTDYGHTDHETVTFVYVKGDKLKQEVLYDNIYTLQYGYINGTKIEELAYPMEVHTVEEIMFIGIEGVYQCGSSEESGVIEIGFGEGDSVNIRMGTYASPYIIGGTGVIVDTNTIVMEWSGGCVFTLKWSEEGCFNIQRQGSSGDGTIDVTTNNVEYVNASYYGVS